MLRPLRVLVVDDDAALRRMFRTALAFSGFAVLEAGDGLTALQLLEIERPDLIVLDLGLPLVSGQAVRQELAAQAHLRDIPVVVVTGIPGPHHDIQPACLLRKPVDPEQLIRSIRSSLAAGSGSGT